MLQISPRSFSEREGFYRNYIRHRNDETLHLPGTAAKVLPSTEPTLKHRLLPLSTSEKPWEEEDRWKKNLHFVERNRRLLLEPLPTSTVCSRLVPGAAISTSSRCRALSSSKGIGETQKPQRLCVQRCFLVFYNSLFPFKGRDGIGEAPSMSPLMPRSRPPSAAPTPSFRTWITLTY